MKTKLHHFAYSITPNNLELVVEVLEKLGCEMNYREGDSRWCLMRQGDSSNNIQIIEVEDQPVLDENKINTHIGFLSESPKENVDEIEKWAKDKNIKFKRGGWSENELWFDLPDVFVNFVIEILKID